MFAASKTAAAAAGTPPPSTDPQFNYVTMLLHGDGTNGAQNNTFVDSSTNNFTITRNGTPTQGSFSPYGDLWSNQFKGTTDYLTVGGGMPSGQGTEFTLEFWAFVPTAGVNVFTEGSGSGTLDFYVESNGTVKLDNTGVANILATASGAFQFGTWVHVALTRTTGNLYTLYINGVSVASGTNSTSYTANTTIGWHRNTASAYFKGYLSNWRVTNTRVYTSAFTPSTTPLTAVSGTSLLTCQNNRFRDNSSNNFAITVTGTPSVQRFSPFDPAAEYSTSVIGGSGYFSGSGQYLSFTGTNAAFEFGTGDWTIETWAYATTIQAQRICDFRPGPGNGPYVTIGMNGSGQFDYTANSAIRITGTTVAKPNTWFHVSVCRSGTSTRLFINGVQEGVTYSDSTSYIVASGRPFIAADSFSPGTSVWAGYLSNFRMLKGTALYTAAFTPPTAPLTAITNTSLLLNTVNAGIFDNAMMNDLVTVGNAQVSTAVKKYGTGSMYFDGSGDYLTTPYTPQADFGSGNFTVEGWVYLSTLSADVNLVAVQNWGDGYSQARVAVLSNGSARFLAANSSTAWINTSTTATGVFTAGSWIHFAAVRNGTAFTLYVDGTSRLSYNSSSTLFNNNAGSVVGIIFANGTPVQPLNGYIDDLRITKGIARYTANFTPPTAAFPNN